MSRLLQTATPILAVIVLAVAGCGKKETPVSAPEGAPEARRAPPASDATPTEAPPEANAAAAPTPAAEAPDEETTAAEEPAEGEPPEEPEEAEKPKGTVVKVETSRGDIVIELCDEYMPRTVSNFRRLVKQKFYDGMIWHRVEDWVIQTGDPTVTRERWKLWEEELERAEGERRQPRPIEVGGEMWMPGGGGSGTPVKFETSTKCTHDKGAVGLARSADPNSGSSQWYIVKRDAHELDDEVRMKQSMGRERGYACFGHVIEGMEVVMKLKAGDEVRRVRITSEPKPAAGA